MNAAECLLQHYSGYVTLLPSITAASPPTFQQMLPFAMGLSFVVSNLVNSTAAGADTSAHDLKVEKMMLTSRH